MLAGTATRPSIETPLTIARFDADGRPDTSFAEHGTVRLFSAELGAEMKEKEMDIATDPLGGVLVYVHATASLVRVGADGKVDTNFGTGGRRRAAAKTSSDYAVHTSFGVGEDRIFVCQDHWPTNFDRVLEVRAFTLDGKTDASFGANGAATYTYDRGHLGWYTRDVLPTKGGGLVAVMSSGHETPSYVRQLIAFDGAGQLAPQVADPKATAEDLEYRMVEGALAYPDGSGVLLFRRESIRSDRSWEIGDAKDGLGMFATGYRAFGKYGLQAVGFGSGATFVVTRALAPEEQRPLPPGSQHFAITKFER